MPGKFVRYLKSYQAGSFCKRLAMVLLALVLMNFGIACYYQCGFGTDPFSVFVDGEHSMFKMTYGQVTNVNNIFLFTFMLLAARKYIHVGSILGVLLSGGLIDLFNELVVTYFPGDNMVKQIVLLVVGFLAFGVSVGLYIVADLGLSAVEAIPLWLETRTKINLRWLRIAEDITFMCIGILLGALADRTIFGDLIGLGTIVGAFGTGPVMKWFINVAGKPMEKWFGPLRKTIPAKDSAK